ncbi:hypothetical protein AAMO2058_000766400 [Amorphochlora amoebiformis]
MRPRGLGHLFFWLSGALQCTKALQNEPFEGECSIERVYSNDTVNVFSPSVLDVTGREALELVKESNQTYVVLFVYAEWCPFSSKLESSFKIVANSFPRGKINFIKVNGHADKRFATQHLIRGYPSVITFFKGKPISYFEGAKTLNGLLKFVEDNTKVHPREPNRRDFPPIVLPKQVKNADLKPSFSLTLFLFRTQAPFDWILAFSVAYIFVTLLLTMRKR